MTPRLSHGVNYSPGASQHKKQRQKANPKLGVELTRQDGLRGIIRIDQTMALSSCGVLASHRGFTAIADGRASKKVVAIARVFTPVHDVRIGDPNSICCARLHCVLRLDSAR